MEQEIERRAKAFAFHEGGTPDQYRARAEYEVVCEAVGASDEPDRMKDLLYWLVDRVCGRRP